MKLSELSGETGVTPATVKYYLREGLLPAGTRVTATQADYSRAHVERIRLIRALVEGAGVRIEGVRRVLAAIENPPRSRHDFLGVAQEAINGPPPPVTVAPETRYAMELLGWTECAPWALAHLQSAIDTAARADFPVSVERLLSYGRALAEVAVVDLDGLQADPASATPSGALRHVAVGTVVTDGVLVALRRLAHEHESARRFGAVPTADRPVEVTTAD